MTAEHGECFISVDVETSGPVPAIFSLLSIGACLVEDDTVSFVRLLKPISAHADPKALEVSGLSLTQLERDGVPPEEAMRQFSEWIANVSASRTPVFVGLNAGFDWSFVNYYFHRFMGSNPFGFAPLDIKALFMGAAGVSWRDTRSSHMNKILAPKITANHEALQDAQAQAELFRLTLRLRPRGVN